MEERVFKNNIILDKPESTEDDIIEEANVDLLNDTMV